MMSTTPLETVINEAWEQRDSININTTGEMREAVDTALDALDKGEQRVAEKTRKAGW